jgi:hypothetical protein
MERRYAALRIIATIYKVLGVLVGIGTVLAAIGFCALGAMGSAALSSFNGGQNAAGGVLGGFLGGVVALIVGTIYTLTLYALGDGISLLLALEENTRQTATLLQQSAGRSASLPAPTSANPNLPAKAG